MSGQPVVDAGARLNRFDRLLNPASDGCFIEVKSRTWSRRDAQDKAAVIAELLDRLGAGQEATIEDDYVDL